MGSVFDIYFGDYGLPVCSLFEAFEQEQEQLESPGDPHNRLVVPAAAAEAASEQVVGSSSTSLTSCDVVEPTQLTQDSAHSKSLADDPAAGLVGELQGSYIYESCIPATCLDALPSDSPCVAPWQQQEGLRDAQHLALQDVTPQHSVKRARRAPAALLPPETPVHEDQLLAAEAASIPLAASQQQQPQQQQQGVEEEDVVPPSPEQHSNCKPGVPVLLRQGVPVECQAAGEVSPLGDDKLLVAREDQHCQAPAAAATKKPSGPLGVIAGAAPAAAAAGTRKKGKLSLSTVRRGAQAAAARQKQQQQQPAHQAQGCQDSHGMPQQKQQLMAAPRHAQQPLQLVQQQPQQPAAPGGTGAAGAPWWQQQQPQPSIQPLGGQLNQQQQPQWQQQQGPQWQQPQQQQVQHPGHVPGQAAGPVAPGGAQPYSAIAWRQHQQLQQPQQPGGAPAGWGPTAAAAAQKRGPTAAARAYRQQKPFKAPQHTVAEAAASEAADARAVKQPGGSAALSRPPGSFKPPSKQQQGTGAAAQPAGLTNLDGDAAAAVAGEAAAAAPGFGWGGFATGRGGSIAVSDAAKARAAALLREELGDQAADEAAAAAAVLPDTTEAAPAAGAGLGGFTTGRGGSIAVSAAARAKAAALLQEELGDVAAGDLADAHPADTAETAPAAAGAGLGGFTTGRGGSIAVSAAASAKAAALLQEELGDLAADEAAAAALPDTAEAAPAAAPVLGGFTTGRGGSIAVSAAARAKAAALLQEELGEQEMQPAAAEAEPAVDPQPPFCAAPQAGASEGRPALPQQQQVQAPGAAVTAQDDGHTHSNSGPAQFIAPGRSGSIVPGAAGPQQGAAQGGGSTRSFKAPRHVEPPLQPPPHQAAAATGADNAAAEQQRDASGEQQLQDAAAPAAYQRGNRSVFKTPVRPREPAATATAAAAAASPSPLPDMSLASEELAYFDRLAAEAEQQLAARANRQQQGSAAAGADAGAVQQQQQQGAAQPQHQVPWWLQPAGMQPPLPQLHQQMQLQIDPAAHDAHQQQQACLQDGQQMRHAVDAALDVAAGAEVAAAASGDAGDGVGEAGDIVIADSQPDSPVGPQCVGLRAPAAAMVVPAPAGLTGAAASAAGGTVVVGSSHEAAAAAAAMAARPAAPQHASCVPGRTALQPSAGPSTKRAAVPGLPGRSLWTGAAKRSSFRKSGPGAGAGAVAVRGIQWAGGDGVLVSPAALHTGDVFAAKMLSLGLLPPAWEHQLLLVELLVGPDGRVQLLTEVLPPPEQRQQQRAGQRTAAAAARTPPSAQQQQQQRRQQSGQSLSSQQQRRQSTGLLERLFSNAANRPPAERPPPYTPGGRKQAAPPKRGSLQALWSAEKLSGSKRCSPEPQQPAKQLAGGRGTSPEPQQPAAPAPPPAAGGAAGQSGSAVGPEQQQAGGDTWPPANRQQQQGQLQAADRNDQHKRQHLGLGVSAGLCTAGGKQQVAGSTTAWDESKQHIGFEQQGGLGVEASVPGPRQNKQQQPSGLSTAGGKRIEVSAAAQQQFMQLMGVAEQQQQQQPPSGLSTAGGRTVTASPAAKQQFQQLMGLHQQPQQQQPPSGLSTAGGRLVEISAAAQQQFQQLMRTPAPAQQQQQQQQPSCGLVTAGGKGVEVSAAAQQQLQQLMRVPEQQQQQQPSCGLVTAGGKGVEISAAAQQQFQQLMSKPQQQQQQQPPSGLSTAGGKLVEISAAAQQQFQQLMRTTQQQQQQQPPSGLSTAGGKRVEASAEAQQRFNQLMGRQAPQQDQAAAQATPDKQLTTSAANASTGVTPATPASDKNAAAAAAAAAATPAAARHVGVAPSAEPKSSFKTPALPPRIGARKRSLSHPHTPGLQQQQQREAGSVTAAGSTDSKAARRAFRRPAMTPSRAASPEPQQQQQGQNSNSPGSSNKKQKLQDAAAPRGLALQEYFTLASAQQRQRQQADLAAAAAGAEAMDTDSNAAAAGFVWVAEGLPVTPKAAAAFAFKAAAAPAGASSAHAQQQQQQQPAGPAAAAPAPSTPGEVWGVQEARTALLAWGADPDKATAAWVANHWKWVVWKLAAYDRKMMGLAGDSSSSWCLSAAGVLQQLQSRYTREVREGQRSVLKKILEQDLPAGVPIVLMVSNIRRRGGSNSSSNSNDPNSSNKPQARQQQGYGAAATAAAAAAGGGDAEVQGMQLSDGWYYVNCMIDGPTAELIQTGRLQVGVKVRVVGAELRSDRAAEPLEAARTALLRASYNGLSPVKWDAKLGPVPTGETLRPLSQVHCSGGLVPRLLLLVQRRYPLLYFCRNRKQYITPKALEAAQQRADQQQEQAHHAASSAALQEELAQARQWANSRSASPLERAYAAAVLQAEGGGGAPDGEGCGAISNLELQAFRAARQSHLETRKHQLLQQQLHKPQPAATAAGADSSRGGVGQQAASVVAASMVDLSEAPIPVMHLRVSGVVPQGCGGSWGHGEAVVKVWRPCEAVQGMEEGCVVLATGLSAGTDGRSSTVEGRGKMLELSSGKKTRWCLMGTANSLGPSFDVPPWQPRSAIKLSQLHESTGVDFSGLLVWAGEVNTDGRDWIQWIFLTDDSAAAAAAEGPQQQPAAAATSSPNSCPLVAVCLVGAPTAVDWLTPSTRAGPQAAACGSGKATAARAEPRQQLSFVVASGVQVQSYDAARGMWVAEVHSTFGGVSVVSGSDVRVRGLAGWAKQSQAAVEACRAKVQQLVGAC